MPRKSAQITAVPDKENNETLPDEKHDEVEQLNRMLAAVLNYLSDDEVEEIDIEYLLDHTEGLRQWWDQYRERNRNDIEKEIQESLGGLSLKDLESIREKIKDLK
ncbi:hypothetical protein [Bacillus sp. T33-2]|uniref:hypothetical protein n=1 Tax=Bacillus sp. T33-2 TaxID=2054168 RepID=UPI000C755FE2|nr:hypothetical protein [Bacillus sp. T33-2]PLR96887.1 hypothetical protein CVD19_09860 [Bacillus sp. T33-2]